MKKWAIYGRGQGQEGWLRVMRTVRLEDGSLQTCPDFEIDDDRPILAWADKAYALAQAAKFSKRYEVFVQEVPADA